MKRIRTVLFFRHFSQYLKAGDGNPILVYEPPALWHNSLSMSNTSIVGEIMEATEVTLENNGGRQRFVLEEEVRIIELDGSVSQTVYLVSQDRSDRKGLVSLKERDGPRIIRVHYRRILPISVDGKAHVTGTGDRFWALCPTCGRPSEVVVTDSSVTCPKCNKTYPLHWLGVKPMSAESATATKATKEPKPTKATKPKAEAVAKEPKVVKEPIKVDLVHLAKLKHCELWTKANVKFDHERVDVATHVLLFTGDSPRKLCFNTYNGTLGKKATELPTDAFVSGKADGKAPWFTVADLEKARAKLKKDGYEQK